jgi:hypothetical protein
MIKHYFTSIALMFSLHLSGDMAGILRSLRDVDKIEYARSNTWNDYETELKR